MRFPRDVPPSNLHALQAWISTWAMQQGVAQDRVQRWIAFELISAAFEAAHLDTDRPLFLLKGGFAMEVRLGLRARDQGRRPGDARGCDGGADHRCGARRPRRTAVRGSRCFRRRQRAQDRNAAEREVRRARAMARTVLARVRLEVSPDEADAARDWDSLALTGRAAEFGITDLPADIRCLQLRYQMAQKLHAVSNPREPNDRFRDLIDLQLLDALHDRNRDPELREACEAVFVTRAQHAWPPVITVREGWEAGYRAMAADLELPDADVRLAVQSVQEIVVRLAKRRDEPPAETPGQPVEVR